MIPIRIDNFGIKIKERYLLENACLEVQQGSSVIIKGMTGSGKSVLLKSLVGILPQSVFSYEGNVRIKGIDSYIDGIKQPRKKWMEIEKSGLLYIPAETAQTMNPSLTLEQNLYKLAPNSYEIIVERLKKYFSMNFTDFARFYPDEVSGGEMQRITLMILLSRDGDLIMLDEPTVNLDRALRAKLIDFLNNEILLTHNHTVLIVTHDIDFINGLTDKQVYELKDNSLLLLKEISKNENALKKEHDRVDSKYELKLENVSQSYIKRGVVGETQFNAFVNMNLSFEASKIYGITGPSGCGKSSMLKSILRLINKTEGKIVFEEKDFVNLKPIENGKDTIEFIPYRKRMVIVQQDSRFSFFPDLTIKESYRQITKDSDGNCEKDFVINLRKIGLSENHLSLYPNNLSSGEIKRLDLARAITTKPDILLLDEPFAFIDFETRNKVMSVLLEYMHNHPTILILVTHEDFDLRYFVEENFDFLELLNQ